MSYNNINLEIEDTIAIVTLDRPEALNAINSELINELTTALIELDKNNKVRVIILTGSEKAFAAGADIKEMSNKTFVDMFVEDFFGGQHNKISSLRKPLIAAVSGYALGGGCELAMMCDFIIASDCAKFGQPEINLGIMAGLGGTQRLTRAVGKSKSMEMNLTGRFMDAAEAERVGLVSRVVPTKDLLKEVKKVAQKISEKSNLSVMAVKESVNRSFEMSLSEGILFERRLFHALFSTDDQEEGMIAFSEKRTPHFHDK